MMIVTQPDLGHAAGEERAAQRRELVVVVADVVLEVRGEGAVLGDVKAGADNQGPATLTA